jgi:hypothetical protein
VRFLPIGAFAVGTTNATTAVPLPFGGVVNNLQVRISGTPGSGNNYTFTVMRNGVATSLVCTIADPAVTCADTDNTVWAAGDTISLQTNPNGTGPVQRTAVFSVTVG